jgi:8-oxo-dGTP pyrophosphatase MutT (NUDIX family)
MDTNMLSIEQRNKAYLNWIKECNQYKVSDYIAFFIDDVVLGYVHKEKIAVFDDFPHIFSHDEFQGCEALTFQASINDFARRTEAADEVAKAWYQSGVISSWVGEQYDVSTGFNHESYFTIERAASSLLGIKKYGIHLNAWVEKSGEMYLWVARRARDKHTFPGKLDHLVAGGHGAGYSIVETMIKECAEEANVPESIASQSKAVSLVSYVMDIKQKLQQDHLFVYDLQLDADFVPENTDGEAEAFYLWPIEKVLECVATTRDYKTNCNLVIIDFAVRHGFLKPDEPYYMDICSGLQHCKL